MHLKKKKKADPTYFGISRHVVRFCQGLPLALEIIGCNLFGKGPEECKSALDTYKKIPNDDIQQILKVSYDGLEQNEKEIFFDMACFFNGYDLGYVEDVLLNGQDFDPKYGIGVLVEISLIKIGHTISMHALIQDMVREIVRQQSQLNLGKQSRLWCYKDICLILEENMGTNKIKCIILDFPEDEEVEWDGEAFKDMKNLRILIIKNERFSQAPKHLPNSLRILHWKRYPSSSFPSNFRSKELAKLSLPDSSFALGEQLQRFQSLTLLDLRHNEFLIQIPDISGLIHLRELNVKGCKNLIEIHDSVGYLNKLINLYAAGCLNLRILPHIWKSTSLDRLAFSGCYNLLNMPKFFLTNTSIHLCGSNDQRGFLMSKSILWFTFNDELEFQTLILEIRGPRGIFPLTSSTAMLSILDKFVVGCQEWSSRVTHLTVQGCAFGDEVPVTMLSFFSV